MENNKNKVIYSIIANGTSTATSVFATLLLPKLLSVSGYGYFQLYLFYASYIGILHLGWADGIYLRTIGKYYDSLNKCVYSAQIKYFWMSQFIMGLTVFSIGILGFNGDKQFVISVIGVLIVIYNSGLFLLYILQATARIRAYAKCVIIGNGLYFVGCCVLGTTKSTNYQYFILAHLLSQVVILCLSIYCCKDLILANMNCGSKILIAETKANIFTGSKIMLAGFSSTLTLGIVRWSIEKQWDVEVFGKISLTLSASNLFMTLINAIATVLLPIMRRKSDAEIDAMYHDIEHGLMWPLYIFMTVFYPVEKILMLWLPDYSDSLKYMALLFPICIFESKTALLLNTYLKAHRREKDILIVNASIVCLSVASSFVAAFVMKSITMCLITILILIAIKCIGLEIALSHNTGICVKAEIIEELIISVAFVIANWHIGGMSGLLVYLAVVIIFVFIHKDSIRQLIYKTLKVKG